jgi:hypothetical protein
MSTPDSSNPFKAEEGPERILSREAVLAKLREYCDSFKIDRELADQDGVYILEVVSDDGMKMYTYQRKGTFPGNKGRDIVSARTVIRVDDLDGSFYSSTLADYNSKEGVWTKNE